MSETLTLRALLLGDLEQELASTRRVLERVPEDHLSWKPHEKSMSLGGLALHLANVLTWQSGIMAADAFDLAHVPPNLAPPTSRRQILDAFDANREAVLAAAEALDDDALAATWTLRIGDHVLSRQPRATALRMLGLSHMVHHRAQLGLYLRLLDIPLPPVYGPTADEKGSF